MVQLLDSDINTREVLGWKGVHVHLRQPVSIAAAGRSCLRFLTSSQPPRPD